jgi:transposase InsO family protein
MKSEHLTDLMLKQVWKLHSTPKTIVSDRGSIFISQIPQELDKQIGINGSTEARKYMYHPILSIVSEFEYPKIPHLCCLTFLRSSLESEKVFCIVSDD